MIGGWTQRLNLSKQTQLPRASTQLFAFLLFIIGQKKTQICSLQVERVSPRLDDNAPPLRQRSCCLQLLLIPLDLITFVQ